MNSKVFAVLFFAAAAYAAPAAEAEAEADADAQLYAGGLLGALPAVGPAAAALPAATVAAAAPFAAPIAAAPLAHAAAPLAHAAAPLAHAAAPLAAAPVVTATAPNCKVENEILVTKSCVPTAENVCTKELVDTEEIEYEKVCKDVVDTICDAAPAAVAAGPAYAAAGPAVAHIVKRDADAEADADADADADAQLLYGGLGAPYAAAHVAGAPLAHAAVAPVAHAAVAPVAHAVAHSAVTTIKHACREVTTQHCVNNPKVKIVPVEVEHCHTVTKVACTDIENAIPKTTCEPVETTHVAGYALPGVVGVVH